MQRNVRNDFTSESFFGIISPLYLDNLNVAVLCLYSNQSLYLDQKTFW